MYRTLLPIPVVKGNIIHGVEVLIMPLQHSDVPEGLKTSDFAETYQQQQQQKQGTRWRM